MGPQSQRDYLTIMRERYRKAVGFEKGYLLDEFVRVCPCHRKHAIRLLGRKADAPSRRPGRPVV